MIAPARQAHAIPAHIDPKVEALVDDLIGCVADKWTMMLLELLAEKGEMRFTQIAREVGTISQKMLTQTLRQMERNGLVIRTPSGRYGVVQIAGLVARRIVCFVKEGQLVAAGERFGLIRFGSRVDVYLPAGTKPLVAVGQYSLGGETIIADLSAASTEPAFRAA